MRKNKIFHFIILIFIFLISSSFTNSSVASEPIEFMLAWDANAEEDLDGYEIYYRTANSDYVLVGDVYIDELADPDNPMVTITDFYNGAVPNLNIASINVPNLAMVNGETYYYAITAFDVQGNTSNFSKELCLEVIEYSVAECEYPSSSASSSVDDVGSSGGGGGGGGCFISATSNYPNKIVNQKAHLVIYLIGLISSITVGLTRKIQKYNP